jgi:hypothetical protein
VADFVTGKESKEKWDMQNCKKLNKYVQARLTYIQEVPD